MKIAYFFTELGLSGGPLVHYNIMNNLRRKGHDLLVITCNEVFEWEFDSHLPFIKKKKNMFDTVRRKINSIIANGYSRGTVVTVRDEIEKITDLLIFNYTRSGYNADVFVGTHTYTADAVYLTSLGNNAFIYDLHFEELMFKSISDRLEIRKLNSLPLVHIVNSTWLKNMFKYNYGLAPEIVYPVVNHNIFDLKPMRKRYNSDIVRIVSYCDPHRPFKGMPQQRKILFNVKERFGKNVEIVIYGNDIGACDFEHTYTGWLSHLELCQLYSSAQILFMPSWFESFPLPPIEAMLCGCVPVANKYGTEDYLIHEHNGLVINPFDTDRSVDQLSTLIENRDIMYSMAVNAYHKSMEFTSDAGIDKFESILFNKSCRHGINIDGIIEGNISEFEQIYPVYS